MGQNIGLIFSLLALLSWSIGDFFIQKSIRETGIIRGLFYMTASGSIIIGPLIWMEIINSLQNIEINKLLFGCSIAMLMAGLLGLRAMKDGKISVIEPVMSIELPIAVLLSIFVHKETLSNFQMGLIFLAFMGVVLSMEVSWDRYKNKKIKLEAGVFYALAGACMMGLVNFLIGISSQTTSALLTLWYTSTVVALVCLPIMAVRKEFSVILNDLKLHPWHLLIQCGLRNAAWLFFAYATTLIPISIVSTITESYIVGGVLLGILVNQERVRKHQMAGIILTVSSIMVLSYNII